MDDHVLDAAQPCALSAGDQASVSLGVVVRCVHDDREKSEEVHGSRKTTSPITSSSAFSDKKRAPPLFRDEMTWNESHWQALLLPSSKPTEVWSSTKAGKITERKGTSRSLVLGSTPLAATLSRRGRIAQSCRRAADCARYFGGGYTSQKKGT